MIRIIILLTALFGACANAAERPVKLFLRGGQSNMDGCGRWNELPEEQMRTPANVRIWDNRTQEWKKIGEDSTAIARKLQFGPELVFCHRVAAAFPDHEIRLVKTSAGGTSLADGWLPEKKKMYARFIANLLTGFPNSPTLQRFLNSPGTTILGALPAPTGGHVIS